MIYRFGLFEFDPAAGELRKQGRVVRIEPQPARALALLLAHPEQSSRESSCGRTCGRRARTSTSIGVWPTAWARCGPRWETAPTTHASSRRSLAAATVSSPRSKRKRQRRRVARGRVRALALSGDAVIVDGPTAVELTSGASTPPGSGTRALLDLAGRAGTDRRARPSSGRRGPAWSRRARSWPSRPSTTRPAVLSPIRLAGTASDIMVERLTALGAERIRRHRQHANPARARGQT